MVRMRLAGLASFLMLASASPTFADPITYSFATTASGSLNGVAFSAAAVTATITADTSDVRPAFPGAAWVMNTNASVSATVNIAGFGPVELFNALVITTNTSLFGGDDLPDPSSFYSAFVLADLDDPPLLPPAGGFTHVFGAVMDSAGDDPLYGYDLTTSTGPLQAIALEPATQPGGAFVTYDTSGGELIFTSNDGTMTVGATGGDGKFISLPGGPVGDPVTLGNNVSQVQGMIGGSVTQAFYRFNWAGGAFSATANVGATNPLAAYAFDLFTQNGVLLQKVILMESNGWSGAIIEAFLNAGIYSIGIDADNPLDPPFSIRFDTPVSGTAPEPTSLLLLATGIGAGALRRRLKHRS